MECKDFTTFSKNLENGGRTVEYAITTDMAKQLSMVESNDKCITTRRYFVFVFKEKIVALTS